MERKSRSLGWLHALPLVLVSCTHTSFLWQAGLGHGKLMAARVPLEDAIKDESIPDWIRALLKEAPKVKAFGEAHGLKPTENYQTFVKLNQASVSYAVTACPPFSLSPKEWWFPISGRVPYLAYFKREDAKALATELEGQGFETHIWGASAYSTLGWFKDPLLSSMFEKSGDRTKRWFVHLFFHESLHATLYWPGLSRLNESLANFVADQLTPLYVGQDSWKEELELRAHIQIRNQGLRDAAKDLELLYQSPLTQEVMKAKKAEKLQALQYAYPRAEPWNNAMLSQFLTYDPDPAYFEAAFMECNKDMKLFLEHIQRSYDLIGKRAKSAKSLEGILDKLP